MAFQYVSTCSNYIIISRTEYSFLSQQSAMSVCKTARFLSPSQLPKLILDSESDEAGALGDSFIYLGNRNLYTYKTTAEISLF